MIPTREQIEAASKVIDDNFMASMKLCRYVAEEVLNAAAQVGPKTMDDFMGMGEIIKQQTKELERLRIAQQMWLSAEKECKEIEAATIERCARVADNFYAQLPTDNFKEVPISLGKEIAAAIRALKDKP